MSNDRKDPREAKTAAGDATSQPSQRRRRLVKGALSAPVFLTLQNGSVFANTSNDAYIVESASEITADDIFTKTKDGVEEPYVMCVTPGQDAGQDGNKYDFGNHYSCDLESLTDQTPEEAFANCRSGGGWIVAGSSHASLCH